MNKAEQILKQITPEVRKREIKKINKTKLPEELQDWVDEYKRVDGERNDFFWSWIYKAILETTFPIITKKYKTSIYENEFLLVMFIILLDDVVDKRKDKKILDELLKIVFFENYIKFNYLNKKETLYVLFAIKIWHRIKKIIKMYPKYEEFKEIWEYEVKQILNALEHDFLINRKTSFINKTEYWLYSPSTMQIVVSDISYLMCIPEFDMRETGIMIEAAWEAQKMARIGNLLSTWEREINENDFTSGIFAYALESEIFFPDDMKIKNKLKVIEKIKKSRIEKDILKDWDKCYISLSEYSKRVKSIKINKSFFGSEKLFIMHMVTKGKI